MALVRFYPAHNFNSIAQELDRAMDYFLDQKSNDKSEREADDCWCPRADIRETKDDFILTFELPGVNKENIAIHFEDGLLKVEGERKKDESNEDSSYLREERNYGKFSRVFKVNSKVQGDKIDAVYKNGLLTVSLPKAEEVKPKEIKINVGK
jgi:HSP20 family protein